MSLRSASCSVERLSRLVTHLLFGHRTHTAHAGVSASLVLSGEPVSESAFGYERSITLLVFVPCLDQSVPVRTITHCMSVSAPALFCLARQ
jgi:hypothetical protein